MKKIETYMTADEALNSFDNGGRFYKAQTKANDGIIDQSELENLGGTFTDKQQMILFLAMSVFKLEEADKSLVFSKLDDEIMKAYEKFKPRELTPHQASFKARIASNTIITGTPKMIASSSDFKGATMFPTGTGNNTILVMTPLSEEYHLYKIADENSPKTFLIAHLKHFDTLPEKRMVVGGIVKEYKINEDEDEMPGKFLDIFYNFKF